MAMYFYASRISAAVCARQAPQTPTHGLPVPSTSTTLYNQPLPKPIYLPSVHRSDIYTRQNNIPKKAAQPLAHECNNMPPGSGCGQNDRDTPQAPVQPLPLKDKGSEKDILYEEGHLLSGTLDALVELLVPGSDYYPDRAFLFAFLLISRIFIKPPELLGQIKTRCDDLKTHVGKDSSVEEYGDIIMPRLIQLMAEWTEMYPYDFRDEKMMAHVRDIAESFESNSQLSDDVSTILESLLLRLTALENHEDFIKTVSSNSTTNSIESLPVTDITEITARELDLAQQLTFIELELLSYIGPEEFIQAFIKDNLHVEHIIKDVKKTRNLESYISWYDRLSALVATEICKQSKKKNRVKIIEFWIETARECVNIGNFNSLMAIMMGLNLEPVSRLRKTWSRVENSKLTVLQHQTDSCSNFSSYRSTLKAALWRSSGSSDKTQRIIIPFFSLLLNDFYVMIEDCSKTLPNGHINFDKVWQLARQVTEFINWKQADCPFDKNHKTKTYLQSTPVMISSALSEASFVCEPPDTQDEKEIFNNMKGK